MYRIGIPQDCRSYHRFGMAVSVISQDHDFSCTTASRKEREQTCNWSDDKLKGLWSSLLNIELVSKCYEDVELQGILLLLETTLSVFKNLKKKHNDTESAYQTMKCELESTKEDLCQMKDDLKRHKKASCDRCPELEKELVDHRKKLQYNENRIKSIVSILSINNSSEDPGRNLQSSRKTAIDKAYDLVSQMFLENDSMKLDNDKIPDVKIGSKRLRHEQTESPQKRTLCKKRKKQRKGTAEAKVWNFNDRDSDAETLYYGATLAPETVPENEKLVCSDVKKEIVPETLCSQYAAKFSDMDKSMSQLSSMELTGKVDDIQSTPKKRNLGVKVTPRSSSPILGCSSKKPTHKTAHSNYSLTVLDSPDGNPVSSQTRVKSDNCVATSLIDNCKDDVARSPSLLNIQSGISNSIAADADKVENRARKTNEKHEQTVAHPLQSGREKNKNIQADFWKLKPIPLVNINSRNSDDAMSRKLKQTTLSLARFSKKQDLCTLREFNGGLRQSGYEKSLFVDEINGDCDEETSLKLAIQESLDGKENKESLSEERRSEVGNLRIDSSEDDFVFASPNASHARTSPRRKCSYARMRHLVSRKDIRSKNASPKKKQVHSAVGGKDMDETLFVPLYTSTLQDGTYGSRDIKRVLETEQNLKDTTHPAEIKNEMQPELVNKLNCSYNRIPEKVSTSPNYKYRRDAVRKREERQKLDGWDCEQCKNYYAVAGVNEDPAKLKRLLKQCSKHRDKYPVQSSTPKGFWDVNFLCTEESKSEDN